MTKEKEAYIRVEKWMIQIPLKANELLIYALIYGCYNSPHEWVRTLPDKEYIAEFFGLSRRTIDRIIKKFLSKNLIMFWTHGKRRIYGSTKSLGLRFIESQRNLVNLTLF